MCGFCPLAAHDARRKDPIDPCRAFEEGGASADACRRAADGTVAAQCDALDAFQRDFSASIEADQVPSRVCDQGTVQSCLQAQNCYTTAVCLCSEHISADCSLRLWTHRAMRSNTVSYPAPNDTYMAAGLQEVDVDLCGPSV